MRRLFLLVGIAVFFLLSFGTDVFAVDGWASMNGGTTGGEGGPTVIVSTAEEFESAVESSSTYIVHVSGNISLRSLEDGTVNVESNKTIRGIDANSTIFGNIAFSNGASNVIIENLNIHNYAGFGEGDGITIKYATNIFITKCNIYDCFDGCLDITRESDYITVSWCKFYYTYISEHHFVNLVGGDDGHTGDMGKLHITFHHNWWEERCDSRMPSVRYGRVHIYNNYYDCPGNEYCALARLYSECLIENNYFDHVEDPYYIYITSGDPGKIGASGNVFESCTGYTDPGDDDVFEPPYSYTLDNASNVPSIVTAGAGNVGGGDPTPPSAPTGLSATAGYGIVGLAWNDNNEPDLAGYNVYRSTTSGGPYGDPLNGSFESDPNYDDEIVTHDTTYYYVVRAVDTFLNESEDSNEVFSGVYGDFTGNSIVEMNDLPDFFDFWLADDCGDTLWLDLDDDCAVNFYEYSVVAENWLKEN